MTENRKQSFDWKELKDILSIREGECKECQRADILKRINCMTDKYGREYVIRKIALKEQLSH